MLNVDLRQRGFGLVGGGPRRDRSASTAAGKDPRRSQGTVVVVRRLLRYRRGTPFVRRWWWGVVDWLTVVGFQSLLIVQDQIAAMVYGGAATNLVGVIWLVAERPPLFCAARVQDHCPAVIFDRAVVAILVGAAILLDKTA